MPERCVDCNSGPRLHEAGPSYSETFPLLAPNHVAYSLTLRICLSCGARFGDRTQIREYLRTKLPAHARVAEVAEAVAV